MPSTSEGMLSQIGIGRGLRGTGKSVSHLCQ